MPTMSKMTNLICLTMVLLPDSPAPSSNSLTSRACFSWSALRMLSIFLLLSMASLSVRLTAQPMAGHCLAQLLTQLLIIVEWKRTKRHYCRGKAVLNCSHTEWWAKATTVHCIRQRVRSVVSTNCNARHLWWCVCGQHSTALRLNSNLSSTSIASTNDETITDRLCRTGSDRALIQQIQQMLAFSSLTPVDCSPIALFSHWVSHWVSLWLPIARLHKHCWHSVLTTVISGHKHTQSNSTQD